jgi:hypothetical protein
VQVLDNAPVRADLYSQKKKQNPDKHGNHPIYTGAIAPSQQSAHQHSRCHNAYNRENKHSVELFIYHNLEFI